MKRKISLSCTILLVLMPWMILNGQDNRKLNIVTINITNDSQSAKYITSGDLTKIGFTTKWEGLSLDRAQLQILVNEAVITDETIEFRDALGRPQNEFFKSVIIPKGMKDGLHKVSIKLLKDPLIINKSITLDCPVKTIDFWIGKPGDQSQMKGETNQQTTSIDPITPSTNLVSKFEVERNSLTGLPYTGVVADGTGSIRIDISGITGNRIKFDIPYGLGSLKLKEGDQAINEPNLESPFSLKDGSATVYYHPPSYIDMSLLNKQVTVAGRGIWSADVPIKFSYEDTQAKNLIVVLPIKILRPRIVLVHGFTGDSTTWGLLASNLKENKFDTMSRNYYAWGIGSGELSQDVFAQSRKLMQDIKESKREYEQAGYKMQKVDVVAHSMGGLIGRFYVNGYSTYNQDVRKLFMVGTPNHGVGSLKNLIGKGSSLSQNYAHWGMAQDVKENSPFMKSLNANESLGGHLNPKVEYYNIYGTFDDGVTNEFSAWLQGVDGYGIRKCCHSPSPSQLSILGPPLTIHPEVFTQINKFLTREIIGAPLRKVQAHITHLRGDVYVYNGVEEKKIESLPHPITAYDRIKTMENSSLTITFTTNDKEWGRIIMGKESNLILKYFSPQTFAVRLDKGKSQFIGNGGHFKVEIMPHNYNDNEWFNFNPKADINSLGTNCQVIYENDIITINLVEGEIRVDDANKEVFKTISTPQTLIFSNNGDISSKVLQSDYELDQLSAIKQTNSLFDGVIAGGSIVDASTLLKTPPPTADTLVETPSVIPGKDCLGKLQVQFIQKTGPSADPKGQAVMRQLDEENKREQFWFNQDEKNFKAGILPLEIKGSYSEGGDYTSPVIREYKSETVTLFKPMKITRISGNSKGFSLMKDSQSFKKFETTKEAFGFILPCGSYKLISENNGVYSSTVLSLKEVD